MKKDDALRKLNRLVGDDLAFWSKQYGGRCSILHNGNLNKGWAGNTVETWCGLKLNNEQRPDCDDGELKAIKCRFGKRQDLVSGGTICIGGMGDQKTRTPFNPNVQFENSHLLEKLKSLILVAWVGDHKEERNCIVHRVISFDADSDFLRQVKEDYNEICDFVKTYDFYSLHSGVGNTIQSRTKNEGRNWYFKTKAVSKMVAL
jgi:DNA mismatch repair protein MutH